MAKYIILLIYAKLWRHIDEFSKTKACDSTVLVWKGIEYTDK